MAVVSAYIGGTSGIFFTAPFDCIVGIQLIGVYQSGGISLKDKNSPDTNFSIASRLTAGMKISNIIMKTGDQLSGSFTAAYITGVSA